MTKFSLFALLVLGLASQAVAAEHIHADLNGVEEVPSVSTLAAGEFRAEISKDEDMIVYELSYEGLQGTITQSHIHVAQKDVNGSIVVWLCKTAETAPSDAAVSAITPFCPMPGGTVTGTLTVANVVAGSMAPQQLGAGELDEVIRAIRNGVAYANVHTSLSGSGEIRGQIKSNKKP